MLSKPSYLAVIGAVGKVTFLELLREKVLYNILLIGFLLFGMALLSSHLTIVRSERVLLDFGLSAINLSCSMISLFLGASVLNREFERRTFYVAMSRPISRGGFVLGKYFGLLGLLLVNWLLLCFMYFGLLASTGAFVGAWSGTLGWAVFFVVLQSGIIAGLALFFSTASTTAVSAMLTIGLFLIGTNISELRALAVKSSDPALAGLLNLTAKVLPNFEYFNLGTKVTYQLPITGAFILSSIGYAIAYTAMLLALSSLTVRSKEA